jgi:dTDP-glucose pyrophosphorylase
MKSWENILIPTAATVREAIRVIDAGGLQLCLAVDGDGKLLGTVSDGDVRRAILRGVSLDAPAAEIMNRKPTVARLEDERDYLLATMRAKQLNRLPMVDDDNRLVGLETLDDLLERQSRDNLAVLMAGGLGERLLPLTEDCPKPLLKVGGRPILETILINLLDHGFQHFYISVNYKAEMIKDYFGDGSRWGTRIDYLEERDRMGTAGALALLPERPSAPFLVMNGDLLTKANFSHLLDFHATHQAAGTMCVREHTFQIPYGVVKLDRHRIRAIEEKPRRHYFFNAGIYVLAPQALDLIPRGAPFDMPSLFEKLLAAGHETAAFHLRDYWLDIGQPDDFAQAQGDFAAEFE